MAFTNGYFCLVLEGKEKRLPCKQTMDNSRGAYCTI